MNQKILRLDWFSFICATCAAFVCFDIFFQFFFEKDIFGIVSISPRHYSGVFGAELIAGGYMQKFALFFFFLPFAQKKNFFYKIPILFIIFIFFTGGITISGNRMPLILFILSFLIFLFVDKKKRKYLLTTLVAVFLFFLLSIKSSETYKHHLTNFYHHGKNLIISLSIKDLAQESMVTARKPYVLEFHCFKIIWKNNPIFGGGLKSYRIQDGGCNNHPHNYYFEILTDLGIVGLSIILFFIFMLLRKILLKESTSFQFNLKNLDSKVMPFFLIFFFEFFPFRTSGSFFTTSNASIIFIVLAILVSLVSKKKR
ncbi:O-antigen ligase family protein [Candidatus Pelagibacter bacterium]|nr:O-antigen ligase family protein [Candidatus Pelagibacter bacterium]